MHTLTNKLMPLFFLLMGATPASAEVSPFVAVKGVVGDFNDQYVELTLEGDEHVHVPRSSIQSKENEVRPNRTVLAYVRVDEITPLPAKHR